MATMLPLGKLPSQGQDPPAKIPTEHVPGQLQLKGGLGLSELPDLMGWVI